VISGVANKGPAKKASKKAAKKAQKPAKSKPAKPAKKKAAKKAVKKAAKKAAKFAPLTLAGSGTEPSSLDARVTQLEQQVKYLIAKVDTLDLRSGQATGSTIVQPSQVEQVKARVKQLIPRGNSMTIDEIWQDAQVSRAGWATVETALLEMVDDEIVDGADGNSTKKLRQKIGRLIRR
jgi:hypothetical protein